MTAKLQSAEASRSPHEWLEDLQKAKVETVRGDRLKVTVADIIERANDPKNRGSLEPTSPRSVEACMRLGIEPAELKYLPLDHFIQLEKERDLGEVAYKFHETVRQERLQALSEERKNIIEEESRSTDKTKGKGEKSSAFTNSKQVNTADMVEKEAKRIEVMKRRQERELSQMVSYEVMRKEMQKRAEAKLKLMEERTELQNRAKTAADEVWRKQQRERELQRLREEEEREKEVKAIEAARYEREIKQAKREAEEDKQRRKLAYLKEQERIEKAEQSRRETERILREQQAEIDQKKADMVRRDLQREKLKKQQQEEAAKKNEEARIKADLRIKNALDQNRAILVKRRLDFNNKQELNEQRRAQKEEARQREEEEKRQREMLKEEQRKEAYRQAQHQEEMRVSNILAKQKEKDEKLRELQIAREHEIRCKTLERQLDLDLKREKVESMKRRDMYQRNQLLHKIQGETERTVGLLQQRSALQQQRKVANMEAAAQRQKLLVTMEKLQTSHAFEGLSGGEISIESLTSHK